jgi:hypothetical protein
MNFRVCKEKTKGLYRPSGKLNLCEFPLRICGDFRDKKNLPVETLGVIKSLSLHLQGVRRP